MSDGSGGIISGGSNSSSSSKRGQSPSNATSDESETGSLMSVVACATFAAIAMGLLAFAGSNPPKRAVWGWVFWHVVNGSFTFGERFLQTGGALVGGALANVPWALRWLHIVSSIIGWGAGFHALGHTDAAHTFVEVMATVLIADMLVWLLRYTATSESLDGITQSASIVLTVSIAISVASILLVPAPLAFAIGRISLMTSALLTRRIMAQQRTWSAAVINKASAPFGAAIVLIGIVITGSRDALPLPRPIWLATIVLIAFVIAQTNFSLFETPGRQSTSVALTGSIVVALGSTLQLTSSYAQPVFLNALLFIATALLWPYLVTVLGVEAESSATSPSSSESPSSSRPTTLAQREQQQSNNAGEPLRIKVLILVICVVLLALPLFAEPVHSAPGSVKQSIRMFGKPKPIDTNAMLQSFIRPRNTKRIEEERVKQVEQQRHDHDLEQALHAQQRAQQELLQAIQEHAADHHTKPQPQAVDKPQAQQPQHQPDAVAPSDYPYEQLFADIRPGAKRRLPIPAEVTDPDMLRPYPFSLAWLEKSKLEADIRKAPALACIATKKGGIKEVRKTVGSFHFFEKDRPVLVFVPHDTLTHDERHEVALMLHTRIVRVELDGTVVETQRAKIRQVTEASELAIDELLEQVKQLVLGVPGLQPPPETSNVEVALLAPAHMGLEDHICTIEKVVLAYRAKIASGNTANLGPPPYMSRAECPPGKPSCFSFDSFFKRFYQFDSFLNEQHYECALQMRLRLPPPSLPLLPSTPSSTSPLGRKPRVCVCTATYSSSDVPLTEQTILRQSFSSMGASIRPDLDLYDFHVYIGSQVDALWDDDEKRKNMLDLLRGALGDIKVGIRVFRYPLSPGLYDIAWKFNAIILQAFVDGCDYFYQWSDDFQWLTQSWARFLVTALEEDMNLGGGGANDGYLMQLGFSGRHHVNAVGAFWGPRMKNWFADNFFQDMYRPPSDPVGRELTGEDLERSKYSLTKHHSSVHIKDSAQLGRRYNVCNHHRVQWEEVARMRRRFRDYLKSLKDPKYDWYIEWAELSVLDGMRNVNLVPGEPYANQRSDTCPRYPTYKSIEDLYEPTRELDAPWRDA